MDLRQFSFLILALTLSLSVNGQKSKTPLYPELELIGMSQLSPSYIPRFDLSGMVEVNGKILVVADKVENPYIYEIKWEGNYWYLTDSIPIRFTNNLITERSVIDLEAIDYHEGYYYIANEADHTVLRVNKSGQVENFPLKFEEFSEDTRAWKRNASFEGIAIDSSRGILYLAKERDPRFIYEVDLKTGLIWHKFNFPETESADISDLKFTDGYLYVLERNGNYVTKIDPKTREVIAKVSYRNVCSDPKGKLYGPTPYGMAETLHITKNEIWIGLDNNGLEVTDLAKERFGLKGYHPVIIKFKRPKGF
jgi:DNA-binding beta-propeller fold protein YncE